MRFKPGFCKELEESRPVKVLQRALEDNRLAHGILLHGDNLDALESVAIAMGGALLETEDAKVHPDLFTLRPANKMRQINAENTRALIKNIQHSPNRGSRKVALIYEADRMNTTAANAFLKTLEEPPADTTLFLLTTRPYALLDTIRSRCLNFRLPTRLDSIKDEAWLAWLADYRSWVNEVRAGVKSKADSTRMLMGVYRLVSQFSEILKRFSSETWKSRKEDLPDNLTDEEQIALESGTLKELRFRLMIELEKATRDAALQNGGIPPVRKLARVVEELEKCVGLMEVNLNEGTALEAFLLESLKVWVS